MLYRIVKKSIIILMSHTESANQNRFPKSVFVYGHINTWVYKRAQIVKRKLLWSTITFDLGLWPDRSAMERASLLFPLFRLRLLAFSNWLKILHRSLCLHVVFKRTSILWQPFLQYPKAFWCDFFCPIDSSSATIIFSCALGSVHCRLIWCVRSYF